MTREELLKLLTSLGVKLGEGGMKEEDAIKLLEGSFEAANRGLIAKRDELLAEVAKVKAKSAELETGNTESVKKISDLEAQIKKTNPEEYKKYYEGQAKELEAKHELAMTELSKERDKYRDSHYTRVRDDAIEGAVNGIKFLPGLRNGFVALAMLKNQFKPTEIDGKTIFTNQDNKTIDAVLHELSLSEEGKAYIQNGNSGGGSTGNSNSNGTPGAGGAGQQITRQQFDSLSDVGRVEFISKGGQIT
jgi:hypothetical protein